MTRSAPDAAAPAAAPDTAGPRRRSRAALALLLASAVLLPGCTAVQEESPPQEAPTTSAPAPSPPPTATPEQTTPARSTLAAGGVSSGHPLASEAGAEVLRRGGTAGDAAVAAAFADAVITPPTSGIGGGGVALVAVDGQVTSYDYREVVNEAGSVPGSGTGIPGFVAGLQRLHADHGALPWADVLAPAIRLAREGTPVSGFLAGTIVSGGGQRATGGLAQFQRPGGGLLREGDVLVQQELADTMQVIADAGADAVYRGDLVPALTTSAGVDADSLAAYEVVLPEPAAGPLGDYRLVSAAPPHPGAAVVQTAQIAEDGGIGQLEPGSAAFVDLQTRAWRVAEEEVQRSLGDPAFTDVPVAEITDPDRNAAIAADLGLAPPPGEDPSGDEGPDEEEPGSTTHISVVDADGRAVSMTNTLTAFWGSGQEVGGFFLNNSLGRFGAIGTGSANVPSPGRRSATWSAPTMVLDREDRPVLVVGTPGGSVIPSVTTTVVLRWALHGEDLAEVVPADRFFYREGAVTVEDAGLVGPVSALGWRTQTLPSAQRETFGSVQALAVDWESGEVSGVADDRRSAGVAFEAP
ncbi:gamma-glutamyltransferase [Pseudokineococcus sp. 1T1Z-3]|uniref:gamma-glutamyltransferase n=1 Tax=Pseudokineococcus sp. 1T1Z-3 TaxID=3132745 RepID=UPI00309BBBD3